MTRYSKITIRESEKSHKNKTIAITSPLKPEIDDKVIKKWQSLIDTIAGLTSVPSGLIMRLNETTIEVFLKSNTEGNPYKPGEKADLIYGLYCETVIGTQKELLVPDATQSLVWRHNNPDIDLNMISYLGMPVNWPDGECYGTICLLDSKENHFNSQYKELLGQVKLHIETDLQILLANNELKIKNKQLSQLNNVKTRFLSLISHDVRGSIGAVNEFLKFIISDFHELDDSELISMLTSIKMMAHDSSQTLENLLSWSKSDLIALEPDFESLEIVGIIEDIISNLYYRIDIKKIEIVRDYYKPEIQIRGDKKMMKIIILNILSNSIKYNAKNGRVTISVKFVNGYHVIEFTDTGIGMSKSAIDNLFRYDGSHSSSGTSGESSAGIGLMLIKEFIDKNNARIDVYSELGQGSTFKITI